MVPPTAPWHRRALSVLIGLLLLATAALATQLVPAAALAGPSAGDLAQQLEQKGRELDGVVEKYNLGEVELGRTRTQVADVTTRLAPLREKVRAASDAVDALAASAYRGSSLNGLNALLSAGSPANLVDRLNTLDVLARRQRTEIDALTAASRQLVAEQSRLTALLAQQTNQQATLAAQKTKIETDIAALEKQRAQLKTTTSSGDVVSTTPPVVNGRAAAVVAYAFAQLGKPYVFGAAGPGAFDCSGLTMMAWRQAGVHLDHSSWAQMDGETTRIARGQLQPGDLVFFYGGEHVGIYIGNNDVIHAPQPGEVVKISSIDWMNGYTASGRP